MAVTAFWYGKAPLNAFGGETAGEAVAIDFLSDTMKIALTTSTYAVAQDTDEFFSDVTNEVVGTGYTAGGATLGSKTLGYTAGTNVIKFDAADPSWATSTITARYAVIYKDTGTPSTSPLLGYIDFGGNISTTAGTFLVTFHADGFLTITAA